ncbi:alpha/beta hydrolase [Aliishimia ponticola]|uniref:Alpha/beta hydrolase n=2 Tax=Aliishimia ponticola TaxID=2499833 RepID=A0A4S4NSH4_9RHOB|nr:alpha/beta hydrolase [Aliishimia ponticola]
MLFPPEGELIEVDGTDIHVQVFGDNGPDLVLLHGASGNSRDFTFSLVPALQDRYRIIVMDRPGLGWSEAAPGFGGILDTDGESPQLQARLLREAAKAVGISRPMVLGHSYGGAVAMAWVLDDPEAAAMISLAGASQPWPGDLHWQYPVQASVPGSLFAIPMVTAGMPRGTLDSVVASIFAPQAEPEGYAEHIGAPLSLRRRTLRENSRQVNGLRPHIVEMSKRYDNLTLPIEILHGDADDIVPLSVHSQPLADQVDSVNLTVLPGIGHMPHHAALDETIAAIDRAATRAGLR